MKKKVVFAGYRDWACKIIEAFKEDKNIVIVDKVSTPEEFDEKVQYYHSQQVEIIVFLGWSWIIKDDVLEKFLCVGIHPSDLPDYRGGSPIQHQIINGINKTKISLMTLAKKLDGGDVWGKEDVSLEGENMNIIFNNIAESSIRLLSRFFTEFPNITPSKQDLTNGKVYKRRKPSESRLSVEDFSNKSLRELYDFIRCLTDPYPNAYLEDENGNRLIFKSVIYEEKK